jgi:hypothetical protein
VSSPTARQLCRRALGPDRPRWLALTQAGLSPQVEGCGGCRVSSYGSGGMAANQSRVPV